MEHGKVRLRKILRRRLSSVPIRVTPVREFFIRPSADTTTARDAQLIFQVGKLPYRQDTGRVRFVGRKVVSRGVILCLKKRLVMSVF